MNIKFPKEEIKVVEKIKQVISNKNLNIKDFFDEVTKNVIFINTYYPKLLNQYIYKIFESRDFDLLLNIIEDFKKEDIENYEWYYYVFASLIANKDLLYIKRLINKSKLFSDPSIAYLIDPEESNYSNIFNLHSELLYTLGPTLILINFTNELIVETINNKLNDEYIMMRFFDLLNILYESGVEQQILIKFQKTLEIIYEITIA